MGPPLFSLVKDQGPVDFLMSGLDVLPEQMMAQFMDAYMQITKAQCIDVLVMSLQLTVSSAASVYSRSHVMCTWFCCTLFCCGWVRSSLSIQVVYLSSFFRVALTHWGRVTHICVGKLTIIASDNGLLSGRRQAIIWTSAGILLIGP